MEATLTALDVLTLAETYGKRAAEMIRLGSGPESVYLKARDAARWANIFMTWDHSYIRLWSPEEQAAEAARNLAREVLL